MSSLLLIFLNGVGAESINHHFFRLIGSSLFWIRFPSFLKILTFNVVQWYCVDFIIIEIFYFQ